MRQYSRFAYRLTLLEIQKLAYFLQESGQELRLQYVKHLYGPYAHNLNKVLEILENLILEFPESSHDFLIEQEYFMYEVMLRRARVFPPLTYSFLNMLKGKLGRKNMDSIMEGYLKALEELENEKIIVHSDGYIKITRKHINAVKDKVSIADQIINILRGDVFPKNLHSDMGIDILDGFFCGNRLVHP